MEFFRKGKGCAPIFGVDIGGRGMLYQEADGVHVILTRRLHQRRSTGIVSGVHFGALFRQYTNRVCEPSGSGLNQWRASVCGSPRIHTRSVADQAKHFGRVSGFGGLQQFLIEYFAFRRSRSGRRRRSGRGRTRRPGSVRLGLGGRTRRPSSVRLGRGGRTRRPSSVRLGLGGRTRRLSSVRLGRGGRTGSLGSVRLGRGGRTSSPGGVGLVPVGGTRWP